MTLLDGRILIGDQNNFCVVAFPLDGSASKTTKGEPVAGTCGHSCSSQGCASVGSLPVKAGKKLGDGSYGTDLVYELLKSLDGRLLLHDMNTETIDYGKAPKAKTEYLTVPIDPGVSFVFFRPTFEPASKDLLVLEAFSKDLYQQRCQGARRRLVRSYRVLLLLVPINTVHAAAARCGSSSSSSNGCRPANSATRPE